MDCLGSRVTWSKKRLINQLKELVPSRNIFFNWFFFQGLLWICFPFLAHLFKTNNNVFNDHGREQERRERLINVLLNVLQRKPDNQQEKINCITHKSQVRHGIRTHAAAAVPFGLAGNQIALKALQCTSKMKDAKDRFTEVNQCDRASPSNLKLDLWLKT